MDLPDEVVKEFQEAYIKDFGHDLSFSETKEMAEDLLPFLYELLSEPEPELSTDASLTESAHQAIDE